LFKKESRREEGETQEGRIEEKKAQRPCCPNPPDLELARTPSLPFP